MSHYNEASQLDESVLYDENGNVVVIEEKKRPSKYNIDGMDLEELRKQTGEAPWAVDVYFSTFESSTEKNKHCNHEDKVQRLTQRRGSRIYTSH